MDGGTVVITWVWRLLVKGQDEGDATSGATNGERPGLPVTSSLVVVDPVVGPAFSGFHDAGPAPSSGGRRAGVH
jgi:hypothetical protein